MTTKIEWCQETWNPITGCTPISEGCQNCYAKRMACRLKGRYGYPDDDPFRVTFHPERLSQPCLKWKKSRKIFVCSMGDLFHPDVKDEWISSIWTEMGEHYGLNGEVQAMDSRPGHTYIILTKRPQRAFDFLQSRYPAGWEKQNVWLGVTAENQKRYDERWEVLKQIPASVRFVSFEPLLGQVDLRPWGPNPDWVITGAETGAGKRHAKPEWFESLRDQCIAANIPFFFKKDSNGDRFLGGHAYEEYPR
ncbi:MAG: phage Gp37/Gp68 family protein [Minisyncoccales bacterium]